MRSADWHVYAVTNGSKQTSLSYYELADIQLDAAHLLSCDDIKVAKPRPKGILMRNSGWNLNSVRITQRCGMGGMEVKGGSWLRIAGI